MSRRFTLVALVAAFCAVGISPVLGYSAAVRERMMVRNLAPLRLGDSVRPVVARDVVPGVAIFDYSLGPIGYGWPLVAVGPDSAPYNIAMLDSSGYLLSRTRMATWGVWDSVSDVAASGNQPLFETHNIASSPVSNKVCIAWVRTDTSPMPGYYRVSNDGGASWDSVKQLDWPAAYGGDTVTSFHISSFYPFYDDGDKLNVLAAVHPIVNDTSYIMPAGIWHWCPDNSPNWHLLRRAGCAPEHLGAPVGYNALYACRPSGCCCNSDYLVAVWEQFDSSNVDPQTNLLRAGIHLCVFYRGGGVEDSGRVTQPGPYSYRFPAVTLCSLDCGVRVAFEVDSVAGFFPLGQGPGTRNPICVRQVEFIKNMVLGELDTIGGTTYDLQACGPSRPAIGEAPSYGLHAAWMYSVDTTGAFPDLNVRYNSYDYDYRVWTWIDDDIMWSGVNVFDRSAGFGCLDVEPGTGVAVVSACAPPPLPQVAVEESHKSRSPGSKLRATVVRSLPADVVAFDALGRRAVNPRPGVYFVREQPQAASRKPPAVRKVVLTD